METRRQQLPNVRVQESVYEVLKDIEEGKIEHERFWAEVDGYEARFEASRKPRFESNLPDVSAVYTPAAKQLDLLQGDRPAGTVRFGDVRAAVPREWGRIIDGAVSASQAIFATDTGAVKLLNLGDSSEPDEQLSGHVLHASVARFFPSEEVAISAGMDYSMKLWDLKTGNEIRTLTHQKGLIDDIAFLGRGRNLLSLSQNSSDIALWEVSQAEVVHEYRIPQLKSVGIWTDERGGNVPDESDPLYEAHNKVVFAGTETSTLVLDIRSPESRTVLLSKPSEQLRVSGNMLVHSCGTKVAITDLRFAQSDVLTLESVQGPIEQLQITPGKTYMRTANGVYAYEFSSKTTEVLCTEPQGVLAPYNSEIWHLGPSVRQFPF